jgi:hypothetical protein
MLYHGTDKLSGGLMKRSVRALLISSAIASVALTSGTGLAKTHSSDDDDLPQTADPTVPKMADPTVNGIELRNPDSSRDRLGEGIL